MFPLPLDTQPMEAKAVDTLPHGDAWQFEPKWDGFRCLTFKAGDAVDLRAKSGKSLSRYFPEMVAALQAARADHFVLDGELAVPVGDTLSFEALQARIHPAASRVTRLATETPAMLILFDCLATEATGPLLETPLPARRSALQAVAKHLGHDARIRVTPFTRDRQEAERWLAKTHGALDGIVAKPTDQAYAPGQRAMLKVKLWRSADCVVGGFRYERGTMQVGSLLLGLFNARGKLDHVGFTSAISHADRPGLTAKLEGLRGGPGFTGDAPGGPSRWSTERSAAWVPLRLELVVEVSYDHVTGGRFRHGTMLLRWRPDKAPYQCSVDQLEEELQPGRLIEQILAAGT
ncbi:MAG: dependent ligase [Rhodopila sp.]|jgi:ATP-dependent DNA ligase|nr:dependent ligase [Rhodopila sp.]